MLGNSLLVAGRPGPGQALFTASGTWVCPMHVTSVSIVAVGRGAAGNYNSGNGLWYAGGGGALGYVNNVSVTPGASYTVTVDDIGSRILINGTTYRADAAASSDHTGGGGFNTSNMTKGGTGGNGGVSTGGTNAGAGGAAGYAGNGGGGGNDNLGGAAGSGGSAGGGSFTLGGGGGGVGVFGQGSSGAGGSAGPGGSGGSAASGASGGTYGGGAAFGGTPAGGAVRIIWPGNLRQFPSTRTTNE